MGLKFDNHISIGHVFTTIMIIVALVTWKVTVENEQKNLRQEILYLKAADDDLKRTIAENRADYRQDIKDIRELLQNILDKVDKKMDRSGG